MKNRLPLKIVGILDRLNLVDHSVYVRAASNLIDITLKEIAAAKTKRKKKSK